MGHATHSERSYRLLEKRLDRQLTGAPASPALRRVLEILFPADEVELACRIPSRPTPLASLSESLGVPADELGDRLDEMARRGVLFDIEHDGVRYFSLPPVVIGFFEFTFMRARDDLPMAELAELFDRYMNENDRFAESVFAGQTQMGRALVREEAVADDDSTEILDWERASRILRSASAVGVSLCVCRHVASHLDKACDRPQRCCLSLNHAADSMIRLGHAEPVSGDEAVKILREAKDAGLMQTADNVQRKLTYICNCCGCCCGMIEAIKDHNLRGAIMTSNWVMQVDPSRCTGCGKCEKACPVGAIHIDVDVSNKAGPSSTVPFSNEGDLSSKVDHPNEIIPTSEIEVSTKTKIKPKRRAVSHADLCLGCGICHGACRFGGVVMKPRAQRVLTPESMFDRVAQMAIERGKLNEMLFDNPEKLGHRAIARLAWLLERSPPFRAAMAVRPIRSAFLRTVVAGARKSLGKLGDLLS